MNVVIEPISIKPHFKNKNIKVVNFRVIAGPEQLAKLKKAYYNARSEAFTNTLLSKKEVAVFLDPTFTTQDGKPITTYWLKQYNSGQIQYNPHNANQVKLAKELTK